MQRPRQDDPQGSPPGLLLQCRYATDGLVAALARYWSEGSEADDVPARFALTGEITAATQERLRRDQQRLEQVTAQAGTSGLTSSEWVIRRLVSTLLVYVEARGPREAVPDWERLADGAAVAKFFRSRPFQPGPSS